MHTEKHTHVHRDTQSERHARTHARTQTHTHSETHTHTLEETQRHTHTQLKAETVNDLGNIVNMIVAGGEIKKLNQYRDEFGRGEERDGGDERERHTRV